MFVFAGLFKQKQEEFLEASELTEFILVWTDFL